MMMLQNIKLSFHAILLERKIGISDYLFLELVLSGIKNRLEAIKKQHQIPYPKTFALSLELPNLERLLAEKFEKREQLETS